MISALVKAVDQLGDKRTRKYVWYSVAAAILTFACLWSVVAWVLQSTAITELAWAESLIDILGVFSTFLLTWFLFPATVSAVIGFFLDQVADCVERKHYPSLSKAEGAPLGESLRLAMKFLGIMVVLNILLLPFLFLGPIFPFVFYTVNGYLLGREYFEMIAARRMPAAEVATLRKAHQGTILLTGVIIAFMLTVPLVNLLMPVVATAAMVHLFEGWRPGGAAGTPMRT